MEDDACTDCIVTCHTMYFGKSRYRSAASASSAPSTVLLYVPLDPG